MCLNKTKVIKGIKNNHYVSLIKIERDNDALKDKQRILKENAIDGVMANWNDVIFIWDLITERYTGYNDEDTFIDIDNDDVEESDDDDDIFEEESDEDEEESDEDESDDAPTSISKILIGIVNDDDEDEEEDSVEENKTEVSKEEPKPVEIPEDVKTTTSEETVKTTDAKTNDTTIEPYSMMSNEYRNILKSDTKPLNASKRTNPVSCFNNSIHTLLGVLKDNNIEDFMKEIPSKYEGVEVTDECITGKQFAIFNNMKSDESIDIVIHTSLNYVPQSMPSQVKADFGASVYVPDGHKNIYVLDYVNKIAVCGIRMVGGKNAEISMSIFPKVDKD